MIKARQFKPNQSKMGPQHSLQESIALKARASNSLCFMKTTRRVRILCWGVFCCARDSYRDKIKPIPTTCTEADSYDSKRASTFCKAHRIAIIYWRQPGWMGCEGQDAGSTHSDLYGRNDNQGSVRFGPSTTYLGDMEAITHGLLWRTSLWQTILTA